MDVLPLPYDTADARAPQLHVHVAVEDQLPLALADVTTAHGLRVLQLQVGPALLELHDRAALYALEELVQLALEQAGQLWLECRFCSVRDSLVTQHRASIAHPSCRDDAEHRRRGHLHLT